MEEAGFTIQAVVIDAKVPICQYRQQRIIQKYLTNRPKTLAGQDLKTLADSLSRTSEGLFSEPLIDWHKNGGWEKRKGELPIAGQSHLKYVI